MLRLHSSTKNLRATRRWHPFFSTATAAGEDFDLDVSKISEIILSSPKSILEQSLDASGLSVTPESAEQVLLRVENAGMLSYRFFQWAHNHHRRRHSSKFLHTTKSHHSVISSLAKIRQYQLMWDLVNAMNSATILNVETFSIIMRKYARAQKVDEAIYTFNVMEKYGIAPNLAAFNSLLSALSKSKNVRKAQQLFDEMSDRFVPDCVTYSILLDGWGRAPNLLKMREVYRSMVDRKCQPDIVTYGIMVDALCKAGRVEEAVGVTQEMRSHNCLPTSFIYSVLVHTYGAEKRIEDAVDTFLEMEQEGVHPDVVTYNALVSAFCRVNRFENAYRVLVDMRSKGIDPNARTCNIILNGLIGLRRHDEAYTVFRRMIRILEPDSDTYTIMIKMFFDCDRSKMALKVWKYMGKKQFVPSMHTFSVLINGLCEKGELDKACVFLEEMIEKGIQPPGTTFGKVRKLLLEEHREDVLEFLQEKLKLLVKEPLCD